MTGVSKKLNRVIPVTQPCGVRLYAISCGILQVMVGNLQPNTVSKKGQ